MAALHFQEGEGWAVVTARPSYARVKTVLKAVKEHPDLELQLIVAASALLDRYGNVVEVMRADGFEPTMEVHMVVEGETPLTSTKTVGLGIVEMSNVLHHLRPDVALLRELGLDDDVRPVT